MAVIECSGLNSLGDRQGGLDIKTTVVRCARWPFSVHPSKYWHCLLSQDIHRLRAYVRRTYMSRVETKTLLYYQHTHTYMYIYIYIYIQTEHTPYWSRCWISLLIIKHKGWTPLQYIVFPKTMYHPSKIEAGAESSALPGEHTKTGNGKHICDKSIF